MAVGDFKGSLTGNNASIGTSLAASTAAGNLNVKIGDLIVFVVGEQTAITSTSVTDNLHNPTAYSAQNAGSDNGTATGRMFYKVATSAGLLTSVTVTCNGGTNNGAVAAVLYQGPFTSIGANPANAQDISSPFLCPDSGVLPQALSLVVGWGSATGSTSWATASPLRTLDVQVATAAVLKVAIGSVFVNSTSAVQPSFTAGSNPGDDALGTASFNVDTSTTTSYRTSQLTSDPQIPNYNYNQQTRTWLQSGLAFIAPPPDTNTYMPCVVDEWPLPTLPPRPDATWSDTGLVGMPPVAQQPPGEIAWPLPARYDIEDRSWFNTIPPQAQATAPPAAPLWPNPTAPQYPISLRTWLNDIIPQLSGTPFIKTDWPLTPQYGYGDRSWKNTIVPQTLAVQPPTPEIWPIATPLPRIDYTWIETGLAYSVAVAAQPPRVTDWPLPRQQQQEGQTWLWPGLAYTVAPAEQPKNQYYWPLPAPAEQPDRTWLLAGSMYLPAPVVVEYMPCVVTEWPEPIPAAQPDRSWLNQGIRTPAAAATKPFNQQDWPLTPAQPRAIDLRSWLSPGLVYTVEFEFQFRAPTFAKTARQYQAPVGFVQGTTLAQLAPAAPQPRNQYDWPNPRRAPATYGFVEGIPTPLNAPAPAKPFNRFDWPLTPAAALAAKTWTVTPLGILSTPAVQPFNQYAWPLTPAAVRPNDLDTWLRAVINIPAAVQPFNQYAWPLGRDYLRPTFIPPQSTPAGMFPTADRPKNQYDWPLRPGPRWPTFIPPQRTHPGFIPAAALPRNQYDWPWPKGPRWPLFIPPKSTPARFITAQPKPPGAAEWPWPRGREYPLSLRSWIVNYTILIPIIVEPPIPPEPPVTPTDPYPYTYPIRHQLDSDYGFRRIRLTHKIRGRL